MATMNMVRKHPQYTARPGMIRVVQSNGARIVSLTTIRIELPWLKVAPSSSAAAIPEWPPPCWLLRARRRTAAEPFCLPSAWFAVPGRRRSGRNRERSREQLSRYETLAW